ncbi:alpha/beta-hydrolase [Armillaria mellea]|nr:alpha/beta-hydrolase [Armillaria mellea]
MSDEYPTMLLWISLSLSYALVYASPSPLSRRDSITTLSDSEVEVFKPYTCYASAGYCEPSTTLAWTCGSNCEANSAFEPVASGGNGDSVQYWYVGYDPDLETVIVAHQGTDTSKLLPVITDINYGLTELDDDLFPGIDSDIEVHSGFKESQADTATDVLAAVTSAMSNYSTKSVTVVGHSLGGAIALLDGVYLTLQLPSASVSVITYGMPRVGNQDFADWVDEHVTVSHINNKKDPVPILPGRFLGFHHCSGEKHITDSDSWVSCPGQDNDDDQCTVGEVGNLLEGDTDDHSGPYDGVTMGC